MKRVNIALIDFPDDVQPSDADIRHHVEQINQGNMRPHPMLIRRADGRYFPIDNVAAARVEARRRCGRTRALAHVISDPGPAILAILRRGARGMHFNLYFEQN